METKVAKQFLITSNSGKTFTLTLDVKVQPKETHVFTHDLWKAFGVTVDLKEENGVKCVIVEDHNVKKSTVEKDFGVKLKSGQRAAISISEDQFQALKTGKEEFLAPYKAEDARLRNIIKAEENAMPHLYARESGFYWGDYSHKTIHRIVLVRPYTERERVAARETYVDQNRAENGYRQIEAITEISNNCPTVEAVKDREAFGHLDRGYELYPITEAEALAIKAEYEAEQARKAEEKVQKDAEDAEKERIADEKRKVEYQDIEENELFLWDAETIYSRAGGKMLHSMGAQFSQKEGTIEIFTTGYAAHIPSANTTYSIKDTLKSQGFVFDGNSKRWTIALTDESAEKTIALLKKYDSKAWPAQVGMAQCWECGTYHPVKRMKMDGPGYYCGC